MKIQKLVMTKVKFQLLDKNKSIVYINLSIFYKPINLHLHKISNKIFDLYHIIYSYSSLFLS